MAPKRSNITFHNANPFKSRWFGALLKAKPAPVQKRSRRYITMTVGAEGPVARAL